MISTGVGAGLLVMLCWGCSDFMLSIPIRKIGTLKSMLARNIMTIILTIPVAVYLFFADRMSVTLPGFFIILTSSFLFTLAYYFFMRGFEIGSLSVVSPIGGAYSAVTVFLALVFLGESLSAMKLIAIVLMISGILFTSTDIAKIKNIRSQKGIKEALLAMIGFGVSMFILGFVSKQMDSLTLFVYVTFTQAPFFIMLSLLKGGTLSRRDLNFKLSLILVIQPIIVNFGWFFYIYGISQDLVSVVTPISSLLPGVTVILALIFYKEKLVNNQKLGILGILAGVYLISI